MGPSPWRPLAGVPGTHQSAPEAPLPAPEMQPDTPAAASPRAAEPIHRVSNGIKALMKYLLNFKCCTSLIK